MKIKIYNFKTKEELQEFDIASAIRSSGKCTVGRSPTSGLVLESSDISRNHGEFKYEAGDYYFFDAGSSNGSLVNNQVAVKNQAYRLEAGQTLQLGEFLLIPQPLAQVYEAMTVLSSIAIPLPNPETMVASEAPATLEDNAKPAVVAEPADDIASDGLLPETDLKHEAVSESEPQSADEPNAEVPLEPVVSQASLEITAPEIKPELAESVLPMSLADAPPPDLINESALQTEAPPLEIAPDPIALEELTVIQTDAEIDRSSSSEEADLWEQAAPEPSLTEAIEQQVLIADSETALEISVMDEAPVQPDEPSVQPDVEVATHPDRTDEETAIELHHLDELVSELTVVPETEINEDTIDAIETTQPSVAPAILEDAIEDVAEPTVLQTIPDQSITTITKIEEESTIDAKETTQPSVAPAILEDAIEDVAEPTVLQTIPDQGVAAAIEVDTAAEPTVLEETDTAVQVNPSDYLPQEFSLIESAPIASDLDTETEDGNDFTPVSTIPEILQQKYIALLAHESQKAALVDFIDRHQATFSNCLLMAPPSIGAALLNQTGMALSRSLPNLTAGGYQQISAAVTSGELLAVVFLRDFIAPQPTQANDEALSRACNVSSVIFAANIATAEAMEGYLQFLITSAAIASSYPPGVAKDRELSDL